MVYGRSRAHRTTYFGILLCADGPNLWRSVLKRLNSTLALIPVLLAASTLNAQTTLTVDKSSLSFTAVAGGSPVSQTVNVSSSAGAQAFYTFPNQTWLSLSPASGTTPAALTVTANPSGLVAGSYGGSVTIFDGLGNSLVINVTLAVGVIGASPSSVTFAYQTGGTLPAAVPISLTGQAVNFTVAAATSSGGNWLLVSPTSGTTPATISAVVDSGVIGSATSPGTYTGTITVTPTSGGTTTPSVIPVTLTVSAAPPVTVTPSSVSLGYQLGGANNQPATITLSSTGVLPVSYGFAIPSNSSWLTTSPTGGSIPADGSTTATISYASSSNLPAGTYSGNVTLFTPGGVPQSQNIPVSLLISAVPLLNVPVSSLSFNYQIGQSAPAAQTVTATSTAVLPTSSSGQMPLTIATSTGNSGNWLSVPTQNPVTGTPFAVAVNPSGLAPATYTGTVTVTGTGAGNGPKTISVTLKVSNDPQIAASVNGCSTLVQQNGCPVMFADQTGQAAPLPQTLKLTSSTGVALNYAATASTTTCGNSWLSLSGATSGSTDGTLSISVTPGAISAGTQCTGSIVVTATNPSTGAATANSPLTIPVSLYVSNTPLLTVAPSALSFTAQAAGNSPAAQNITIGDTSASESLNYSVTYSTASGSGWLFVGPTSGLTQTGSNVLTVSIVPGVLAAGTYTATITINATTSGGGAVANSPVTVPVVFTVTAGTMSVSPTSLSFTQTQSGAAPQAQTVTVSTTGQSLAWAATVSTGGTGDWLSVTPTTGAAGTFQVTVNGSTLQPNTYHGTVTVTATTPYVGNSPIVIPVTLVVTPGTISVSPASLTFTQIVGSTAPPSQDVTVTGTPGALAFTVTATTDNNSGSWLSATPASGTTTAAVHVSASAGTLPIGQYTGTVTIDASGSTQKVKVTLNVVSPQTLTVSPSSLNFAYTIGLPAPATQTVQLSASGGLAQFVASASTKDGGTWLTVTPTSGTTPATLTVGINTTGLTAGNYTGTITIASPEAQTQPIITVNLTVSQIPKPVIAGIVNAATYISGGFSPGENIVIFGTGVGPASLVQGSLNSSGVLSTNVSNTQVFFDAIPAPIIYASSGQTSVMVPYGISGRTQTSVVVSYMGMQSESIPYNVVQVSPGIYTLNQAGSGPGAILNQDYSLNSSSNAAAKGTVVQVYMTGEGVTQPPSTDGGIAPVNGTGLNKPVQTVTATVGGMPATVEYAGSAPGIVYGVMQVNVIIPSGAPSGAAVPIQVAVGGVNSQNNVTVAVK